MHQNAPNGSFYFKIFLGVPPAKCFQFFSSQSTPMPARRKIEKKNVISEHINGLVQERRNSSALAMELHLSCTNPLLCYGLSSWAPCQIFLRWMSQNIFDEKSTLVQAMAWCHQAASHYLSQCWPRSMASLGHNELNESHESTLNYNHHKTRHNKTM